MTDRRAERTAAVNGASLPDDIYAELVRSLFETVAPATIMAIAFLGVAGLILRETPDLPLAILTALGGTVAFTRVGIAAAARPLLDGDIVDIRVIRLLERSFAAVYLSFATVLGLFAGRAFMVAEPHSDMLLAAILFGYGAGVAAGVALRPWIAVPAMVLAALPTLAVALLAPRPMLGAYAVLMSVYTAGGIGSLIGRFRGEVRKTEVRVLFGKLARHDELTGLPNRLAMRESFLAASLAAPTGTIAVHCLDLDRFKPVNDHYGHPVGDALLKAVAERLSGLLRHTDFAARIGGDEFVIVQTGIGHEGEAEMLARRIVRAVAQPFRIDGREIEIGTSVGFALSADCGGDLDRLIAAADTALYDAKRSNGIAAFHPAAAASEAQTA